MNKQLRFKNRIKKSLPYLCIFLFAVCLVSAILIKNEFWSGYDTYFHMNSIYEDAMQIKSGHFSYFISLFGFEQSGRIVNSLYGPLFNYLCGALLLWCHSWIHFEFILFFITISISGVEVYVCAEKLRLNRVLSIILALFYMSSYPVTTMWLTNWEFTGLGAAVLIPMILIIGIDIYQRHQIRIVPLAVSMAICLQIHLITSLISVLILVPLVICGFIQTNAKWKMIKNGLIALIISVCLSGNIFSALYDVFRTNHLIPTFPHFDLQSIAGNNSVSIHRYMITDLGYLYTFLIVVVLVLMIIERKHVSTLDWCLLFEDIFFLIISSTYFPWNFLLKLYPKLSIIIQFPARFVGVTFILTLLLLGRMLSKVSVSTTHSFVINVLLVIILVISLKPVYISMNHESHMWQASSGVVHYWARHMNYGGFRYESKGQQIRKAVRSHDLHRGINVVHKVTMDYLPTSSHLNIYNYYNYPTRKTYVKTFQNQGKYHKDTSNHTLLMNWRSSTNHQVEIPLVKYGNTMVHLNHRLIHPNHSIVGTMMVKPRKGLNRMRISYQPGRIFKIMSVISLISWLIIIIYVFHSVLINVKPKMRKKYVES